MTHKEASIHQLGLPDVSEPSKVTIRKASYVIPRISVKEDPLKIPESKPQWEGYNPEAATRFSKAIKFEYPLRK